MPVFADTDHYGESIVSFGRFVQFALQIELDGADGGGPLFSFFLQPDAQTTFWSCDLAGKQWAA